MRIYHNELLEYLPRLQLLQLHRECCRLRTHGWGHSKHENHYIFNYGLGKFYSYHMKVIAEMHSRRYRPNLKWTGIHYRGRETPHPDWLVSASYDAKDYVEQDRNMLESDLLYLISLFQKDSDLKKYTISERSRIMTIVDNL